MKLHPRHPHWWRNERRTPECHRSLRHSDGSQYLAQRFSLFTILTAGFPDTQNKLSPNLADNAVLGLGLSNAVLGFLALPNVVSELKAIVRANKPDSQGIFQGIPLLNGDFTLNASEDILDYRILHMATHGKFDSEDPEKSFLVLERVIN